MKSLLKICMAVAAIIFAGCQKQNLTVNEQSETGKATITASIGDMTKVGFEDLAGSGLKVTWSAGDKIGLYDENGDYACVFVLTGGAGEANGTFEWESGEPFDANNTYTVVYPYIEDAILLTEYATEKTIRLATEQTQEGTTLDHLANLCFMEGTNSQSTITFAHTVSIITIKFAKPTTAGASEKPTAVHFSNGFDFTYKLNLKSGEWTNAAYMIIDPVPANGRPLIFEVDTDENRAYGADLYSLKEHEPGKRYTANIAIFNMSEFIRMKFTIDTRKNPADPTDKTFIAPLPTGTISGYDLSISWGDGNSSILPNNTDISIYNLTHNYPKAGKYQITISSTETNAANQQIPELNFGINSPYEKSNCRKLISMDTPMLNTGAMDFAYCFKDCINLTTISAGLFDKNPQMIYLGNCFHSCKSLTAIPAGLFDKNTEVTHFAGCFNSCLGLTNVPEGLFKYNKRAISFFGCFTYCDKLKLNPNIFCDEATEKNTRFVGKTVDFTDCFDRDSFTGNQGTAPALWEYTGTLDGTNCFGGTGNNTTSLSNYNNIPQAWGGPKP